VEDALLAKAYRLYVAAAIEDGKGVAVKQNSRAIVGECGGGSNIELLTNLNDILLMLFLYGRKHR
jgi:hypothetical protein